MRRRFAEVRNRPRRPHPIRSLALLGLLVVGIGGCRDRAEPKRPQLVLSVVLDQLGTWALERHLPHLPEDGVLRHALDRGMSHRRVRYPYGATITAAGHATLFTGVAPRVHGVVANDRYDPARGEKRALVDDGEHRIFGVDGGFAGPGILRVPTVGDALVEATGGRAKVVALSIKDRASVLPAGRRANLAVFYDKRRPGFTTSSFYAPEPPAWLVAFDDLHPLTGYYRTWTPLPASLAAGIEDDRAVEGALPGFDRTFPHDPKETSNPASALRFFPASTDYLIDLARAAVDAYALGEDEVPDLLSVSVSATDYIGHKFGGDSLEYLDNLIRTDRALTALVRDLERRTRLAVVITSDHGHAPTPDAPAPPRIFPPKLLAEIDARLAPKYGAAKYGAGYHVPYLYLTPAALEHPRAEALIDDVVAYLRDRKGVAHAARTSSAAATWPNSQNEKLRAAAAGIDGERGGTIYIVPAEDVIVDTNLGGGGTTHGTPWLYDRDVPVLGFGVGIRRATSDRPLDIRQYASTLAALLGIEPPAEDAPPPLPGAR